MDSTNSNNTQTAALPIRIDELRYQIGQHIKFRYLNPGDHGPNRDGVLIEYNTSLISGEDYIRLLDYTVQDDPNQYRTFSCKHIRNLHIVTGQADETPADTVSGFFNGLSSFVGRFIRNPRNNLDDR